MSISSALNPKAGYEKIILATTSTLQLNKNESGCIVKTANKDALPNGTLITLPTGNQADVGISFKVVSNGPNDRITVQPLGSDVIKQDGASFSAILLEGCASAFTYTAKGVWESQKDKETSYTKTQKWFNHRLAQGATETVATFEMDENVVGVKARVLGFNKARSVVQTGDVLASINDVAQSVDATGVMDIGGTHLAWSVTTTSNTASLKVTNNHPTDDMYVTASVDSVEVPRSNENPMLLMVIYGLKDGYTWHGLGNGQHLISPNSYDNSTPGYENARFYGYSGGKNIAGYWNFANAGHRVGSTSESPYATSINQQMNLTVSDNLSYYDPIEKITNTLHFSNTISTSFFNPSTSYAPGAWGLYGGLRNEILTNTMVVAANWGNITFKWQPNPQAFAGAWNNY